MTEIDYTTASPPPRRSINKHTTEDVSLTRTLCHASREHHRTAIIFVLEVEVDMRCESNYDSKKYSSKNEKIWQRRKGDENSEGERKRLSYEQRGREGSTTDVELGAYFVPFHECAYLIHGLKTNWIEMIRG